MNIVDAHSENHKQYASNFIFGNVKIALEKGGKKTLFNCSLFNSL